MLAAGRGREAAIPAGYRTDAEIEGWLARNTRPLTPAEIAERRRRA